MFKKLQALLSNKLVISAVHGVEGFVVTVGAGALQNLVSTNPTAIPSKNQLISAVVAGAVLAIRQQVLPLQSNQNSQGGQQ